MNSVKHRTFCTNDPANQNTKDLTPEQLNSEEGYIAKKLPDMRIDKRGRIWRANPKIQTSFPASITQEEWDRMMSK